MNKHWAHKYIGLSYFDVGMCWGFVQICCRERFGEEMPEANDERSIRLAAQRGGWKRVDKVEPDDIVVMTDTARATRHVGFAVDGGIIHAFGTPLKGGAVVFDLWADARARGLSHFEFWRHGSGNRHPHQAPVRR